MANKLDFFFEQLVTESDMDTLQANLELADQRLMLDQGYTGVVSGFAVTGHLPVQDFTVDIAGPGVAYDQEGQRIRLPASTNLDVSTDSNGSPVTLPAGPNEKWVSVFVQYERVPSDLRFDGNGLPVNFRLDESLSFVVVQGAEALIGTAIRPALLPDALLIADIYLINGQTQIFNADIESADVVTKPNSRFQFIFNLTASSPAQVRVGPLPDAMQAVLSELNTHVADLGNAHPASAIVNTPNTPAGNIAAVNVQTALNELDTEKGGLDLNQTWTGDNQFNGDDGFGGTNFFTGDVTLQVGATLAVNSTATFNGTINLESATNLNGVTIVDVGGSLTADGPADFNGAVTFDNTVDMAGQTVTVTGATIAGNATISGANTYSGVSTHSAQVNLLDTGVSHRDSTFDFSGNPASTLVREECRQINGMASGSPELLLTLSAASANNTVSSWVGYVSVSEDGAAANPSVHRVTISYRVVGGVTISTISQATLHGSAAFTFTTADVGSGITAAVELRAEYTLIGTLNFNFSVHSMWTRRDTTQ